MDQNEIETGGQIPDILCFHHILGHRRKIILNKEKSKNLIKIVHHAEDFYHSGLAQFSVKFKSLFFWKSLCKALTDTVNLGFTEANN